jgi:Lon protease-like protein
MRDVPALSQSELEALPIFPLPRVVFFPGTLLPLHLFEQRYRDLAEWCTTHGPAAMAIALLEPGYEDDYEGRPSIRSVAGAGRIVAHERNADGTHDLVLHGVTRVSLEELGTDQSFRIGKATALRSHEGSLGNRDVTTLVSCATQVAQVVRRKHPDFSLGVGVADPPGLVADTIADRFVADPDKRQAILEALDLGERVHLVTDAVGELLAMLASNDISS